MTNQIIKQKLKEFDNMHFDVHGNDVIEIRISKLRNFFIESIDQAITQAVEEAYVKGFVDGFDSSGEGYNGEYVHSNLRGKGVMEEKLRKAALDKLTNEKTT